MENKNSCPRFYWVYGVALWLMLFVVMSFVVWCRFGNSDYYVDLVASVFVILSFLLCSAGIMLNIVTLITKNRSLCRYSGDLFFLSAIACLFPVVIEEFSILLSHLI